MANWKEWRQPWHLLVKKSPKRLDLPSEANTKFILWEPEWDDENYYLLKEINSDLLIAISHDDVVATEKALKKDKIDVNNPYRIPPDDLFNVDGSETIAIETFLHRAVQEHSENVFKFLLDKGANPRIQGHDSATVIDNVFDEYHSTPEELLKFATILIDANLINAEEIEEQTENSTYEYKAVIAKLIQRANSKVKSVQNQKNKRVLKNPGHTRD